jgi:hypothetical protein
LESPNFTRSLDAPDGGHIGHLFLVGGFAESSILQEAIRSEFGQNMNVIIPQVKERLRACFSKLCALGILKSKENHFFDILIRT